MKLGVRLRSFSLILNHVNRSDEIWILYEMRVEELEEQLTRRSQVEDKVNTIAKRQEDTNAPFFVKCARWFRQQE